MSSGKARARTIQQTTGETVMSKTNDDGYTYDIPTEISEPLWQPEITIAPAEAITKQAIEVPAEATTEPTPLPFWKRQVKNSRTGKAIIVGAIGGLLLSSVFYGVQQTTEKSREMAMNYAADTLFYDLQTTQDDPNITSENIEADFKERMGFTTFQYNVIKMDDCFSVSVEDPVFGGSARRAFGYGCFYEYSPDDQRTLDGIHIETTQDEEE